MKDNNTLEQVVKFGIIGVTAVGLDFLTYYSALYIFEGQYTGIAKSAGFVMGTFFTYYMNKTWTWKQKGHSTPVFMKFLILYGIAWGVNVGINELALRLIPPYELSINLVNKPSTESLYSIWLKVDKLLAFGAAVVVTAMFTFFGQKFWVFKSTEEVVEEVAVN